MNPDIDLKSFRREGGSVAPSGVQLVGPPRRIMLRYVLPGTLIFVFLAIGAFAVRNSLMPATTVSVVLPIFAQASDAATAGEPGHASHGDAGGVPQFQAPGWIEPDPFPTVIPSLIAGTVSRVNVREGESVSSGTVVAELDDADARLAVRQAEAELAVRRAEADAAQANWDNPIVLEEAVASAKAEGVRLGAERARSEKQLQIAEREASINQSLSKGGSVGMFSAQKAEMEAASAKLSIAEVDAKIAAQKVVIDAAEKKLRLRLEDKQRVAMANAHLEESHVAVDEAKLRLARCRITAPSSGTVMKLHVAPGSMISMSVEHGVSIASIYDPDRLQVRADVPLADAAKIKLGLQAEIRVEAFPDRVFKGELTRVVHEADVRKNALPIKVRIIAPDPALKPEMIARLQLSTPYSTDPVASDDSESARTAASAAAGSDRILIPGSLVPDEKATEAQLWVLGPDQRAHMRAVKLGTKQGDNRVVLTGLNPSDKIIASDTKNLKEGSRVRVTVAEPKP